MPGPPANYRSHPRDVSPALLRFNGTSWSPVALNGLKNPGQERLELQMLSANEGWAVGTVREGRRLDQVTLLQHYVAGTWQKVALPDTPLADITSFSCVSPDDCWALGASATIVPGTQRRHGGYFILSELAAPLL